MYTLERLAYNRGLRPSAEFDLTAGFDLDGYRIASADRTHVASLKGVIADEVRFERGVTRLIMSLQARCERLHVQRAREFYRLAELPSIVPEPIDLAEWRRQWGGPG